MMMKYNLLSKIKLVMKNKKIHNYQKNHKY